MSLTVIIPSKSQSNLTACVRAVKMNEPALRVIVVDDGLDGFTLPGVDILPGVQPFVFARNCNLGISEANDDDVVLLNDDAILATPLGFTAIQSAAYGASDFGVISAATNVAGNPEQFSRGVGLREAFRSLAFVCVLIPRTTLELVGLLDERFTAYGWDDNDYCRRVRQARLKLGVFDGCFVDHGSLQSTYRGHPHAAANITEGAKIYADKWGDLT